MKTLEVTDDQLRVLVSLFHIGVAIMAGHVELIPLEVAIIQSVPNDDDRAEELQAMLLKAADPATWELIQQQLSARDN